MVSNTFGNCFMLCSCLPSTHPQGILSKVKKIGRKERTWKERNMNEEGETGSGVSFLINHESTHLLHHYISSKDSSKNFYDFFP